MRACENDATSAVLQLFIIGKKNRRKFMQEKQKRVKSQLPISVMHAQITTSTMTSQVKLTLWPKKKPPSNQKLDRCQQQCQRLGILDARLLGGLCQKIGKHMDEMAANKLGKGEQIKYNLSTI